MDDIKKQEKKNVGLIDAREYSTVSSTKNDVLLGFYLTSRPAYPFFSLVFKIGNSSPAPVLWLRCIFHPPVKGRIEHSIQVILFEIDCAQVSFIA